MQTRSQTLKRKDREEKAVPLEKKSPVVRKKVVVRRKSKSENQPKITDFYKKQEKEDKEEKEEKKEKEKEKKYGFDQETGCWHCLECGENMGTTNSRQLCGKYYCYYSS